METSFGKAHLLTVSLQKAAPRRPTEWPLPLGGFFLTRLFNVEAPTAAFS